MARRRRSTVLTLQSLEERRLLATYAVTTALDVVDDADGEVSLREAIEFANQNPGQDTITFAPGSFDPLGFDDPTRVELSLGQLAVTDSLIIIGPGANLLSIDGQDASRVLDVLGDGVDVFVDGLTITGGQTLEDGLAGSGAAIRFESTGALTLRGVSIRGNQTFGDSAHGGGVYASGGEVVVAESSFSANATNGIDASGGAIRTTDAEIHLINTTVSGNVAGGIASHGGGLHASGTSNVSIIHSTVASNSAQAIGGGVSVDAGSIVPLRIANSVIATNQDAGVAPDLYASRDANQTPDATTLDVVFSLIGDNSNAGLLESQIAGPDGNLIGSPTGFGTIDPMLQPLAINGGPTLTRKPATGSPLIDAGDDSFSRDSNGFLLNQDQRGLPFDRVFSLADIGAFETQPPRAAVVQWLDADPVFVGTPLGDLQLSAVADTPGTFNYTPPAGTVLNAGNDQTLAVVFTPVDSVHYQPSVARIEIDVVASVDRGDAPQSYGVTDAANGPTHLVTTLTLGATVDADLTSLGSDLADGDGPDDDGVVFSTSLVADPNIATRGSIVVTASEASRLDAWIDFDRDGTFNRVTEHIAGGISMDLVAGENFLPIVVPAGASPGLTFARFRISTGGDLLPTGPADDGEVEDYALTLLDGETPSTIELNLTGSQITLAADGTDLIVSRRATEVFRAPRASIQRYNLATDEFSNVLIIDNQAGPAIPEGGLAFDGGDRVNTVRWIGSADILDVTSEGNLTFQNVDVIDLADAEIQTFVIDTASARAIDPTGGGLLVTGGREDLIVFADSGTWRMDAPESVAGVTFATVRTIGTFVQTDFSTGWQNLATPSDVSNDGETTALDALRIINELARRAFSDPLTSALVDPGTVDPWPNTYYDQNGDGSVTALDALRVINQLARLSSSGNGPNSEGEHIDIVPFSKRWRIADASWWSDQPIDGGADADTKLR